MQPARRPRTIAPAVLPCEPLVFSEAASPVALFGTVPSDSRLGAVPGDPSRRRPPVEPLPGFAPGPLLPEGAECPGRAPPALPGAPDSTPTFSRISSGDSPVEGELAEGEIPPVSLEELVFDED